MTLSFMRISQLFAFLLLLSAVTMANTYDDSGAGIDEQLGKNIPLDLVFTNSDGQRVALKDIVKKPTILFFVYYNCPSICNPLIAEVASVIQRVDLRPVEDYEIITISIDHNETYELAARRKEEYLFSIAGNFPPKGWYFMTGDSVTIAKATSAAGFRFTRVGDQIVHPGALMFLSPEGKISRYLFIGSIGVKPGKAGNFLPFDIKMALFDAGEGKITPTVAKVLQMCFTYDPEAGQYALNFTRISGILIVLLVGIFVIVFIVKPKKKSLA